MAVELAAEALLSTSLQVLFERLASEEIPQLFEGKKPILDLLYELNTRLLSANLLLNEAEEKQLRNEQARKWLFKLQDVIYEADDLVDRIDYEALRSKLEGESSSRARKVFMKLKLIPTFFNPFDNTVKRDATEILCRLKILLDQKDALGLREGFQNKPSQSLPAPLVEESGVFGRDADKEVIVDLLLSDDVSGNKISVIPIVGMGGIGKTTLAQLVYEDDRVKQHFELKAWVTVSDEFDIFKITKTIFEGVTSNECHIGNLFELQRKLKEALRGKKFLFVHDDVWNENYHLWDALKSSFESGANGSKIIVTTRSKSVASVMATGKDHYLTDLSEEDCWRLFAKHAFGINADLDAYRDLQAIGRDIVSKCKGLPLAIKSLGGLLRSERNPRKWEDILNSDVWELYKKEGNILPALWLSYRHLPAHLKRCFAYCSIFPKDYEFERREVILLWMAEGLLQTDKKCERMEELGEEYFQDLLSRSLFQCSSKKESVLVMHDLVHDLAMFISDEFCFRLDLNNDLHSLSSKTRHFSYRKGTYDVNKFEGLCKAKCLHTFIALPLQINYDSIYHNKDLVPYDILLTAGSCLRVLSLSRSSIKELPDSISNLKHLRYLDLSDTEITELPDSICTLYNLQTLLLSECKNLSHLPKGMGSLINLRYLDLWGVPLKKMPQQISNIKKLNIILPDVVLGDGRSGFKMKELAELEYLQGKLRISGIENIVDAAEASEANLKDKKYLSGLELRWNAGAAMAGSSQKEKEVFDALRPHTNLKNLAVYSYRGTRLSDWIGDHTFSNLVSTCIWGCKYCCFLPPLGQLPSLKDLVIGFCDSVVSIGDEVHYNGPLFSSLEKLIVRNMLMWKEWSFKEAIGEGQIFPLLKELYLENCPKLNVGLPCYLPSLEDLHIEKCEEMVVLLPRSRTQQTVTASPSLVSMYISDCQALESLLDWGSHSKLRTLKLYRSKTLLSNSMHWDLQRLSGLEFLNICGWEDDSFLDEGLLPTTLTRLWIQNCSNLETLNGKAFQQLTSLTSLRILSCKSLRCLPEEGLPPSLSDLEISYCPLLKQRCEKDGEDWPKISHIPSLSIKC